MPAAVIAAEGVFRITAGPRGSFFSCFSGAAGNVRYPAAAADAVAALFLINSLGFFLKRIHQCFDNVADTDVASAAWATCASLLQRCV